MIPSWSAGSVCGFIWSKSLLVSLQWNEESLSREEPWLQPTAACGYHLFLASLLYSKQYTIASAFLCIAYSQQIPGLLPSLEYLLHCALNSDDSSFLTATLRLLSRLPQFSHLLVRCLRKQERSTWPFAVHSASDILQLFRSFLLKRDFEYAVTTISILQGLQCSLNRVAMEGETEEETRLLLHDSNLLRDIIAMFSGDLEFVPSLFANVFSDAPQGDCVAHRSGLQLLLVALLQQQYDLLPDIYRFLQMEVDLLCGDDDRKLATWRPLSPSTPRTEPITSSQYYRCISSTWETCTDSSRSSETSNLRGARRRLARGSKTTPRVWTLCWTAADGQYL